MISRRQFSKQVLVFVYLLLAGFAIGLPGCAICDTEDSDYPSHCVVGCSASSQSVMQESRIIFEMESGDNDRWDWFFRDLQLIG